MTVRKRKTPQQLIDMHKRKASALEKKVKNVEKAKRTRQLILHGEALVARAAAGDPVSQAEVARNLLGLTRKHDRAAFDLEPLSEPGPDDQQPVNPPVLAVPPVAPVLAAPPALTGRVHPQDRLNQAWAALSAVKDRTPEEQKPYRMELGEAIAGVERVSRQLWAELPAKNRGFYGLSDRPGEMLQKGATAGG